MIEQVKIAKLDRISHIYLLEGKEVTSTEWFKTIKKWICLADQNSISIRRRDDDECLLYVIESKLFNN